MIIFLGLEIIFVIWLLWKTPRKIAKLKTQSQGAVIQQTYNVFSYYNLILSQVVLTCILIKLLQQIYEIALFDKWYKKYFPCQDPNDSEAIQKTTGQVLQFIFSTFIQLMAALVIQL